MLPRQRVELALEAVDLNDRADFCLRQLACSDRYYRFHRRGCIGRTGTGGLGRFTSYRGCVEAAVSPECSPS